MALKYYEATTVITTFQNTLHSLLARLSLLFVILTATLTAKHVFDSPKDGILYLPDTYEKKVQKKIAVK